MTRYVPNEQGELSALDLTDEALKNTPQMQPGDLGAAFVKMLLSLVILIALLAFTYWALKKLVRNRLEKGVGNGSIHLLEKRMISPKTMLYLVEADGKKILFAESHLEIKKLSDLSSQD